MEKKIGGNIVSPTANKEEPVAVKMAAPVMEKAAAPEKMMTMAAPE
jgi:hypothetical protein